MTNKRCDTGAVFLCSTHDPLIEVLLIFDPTRKMTYARP
jgi:hypothetical protein